MGDVHLFLLIHGLWGKPCHLDAARNELEAAWEGRTPPNVDSGRGSPAERTSSTKEELVVVVAEGMTSKLTYDGVDVCASRVAWEVDKHVSRLEAAGKRVTKFSIMGYSLGGLVARYLVGLLHARSPSFFDTHPAGTFTTIATPHLGVPRYNTFLSTCLCFLGGRLMSRTGEQLYVTDKYSEEDARPLLEIMADPKQVFHQGLSRFPKVIIYANIVNDSTVPFPSAAVEATDPFVQWAERDLEVNADEAGILSDWHFPSLAKKPRLQKGYHLGTLPPILRARWPFNYIILALFPILFPILFILVLVRFALDSSRSRKRLQRLARVSKTHVSTTSPPSSVSSIPSPLGLSIDALRKAIREVERNIEQDLIEAAEYDMGGEAMDHAEGNGNDIVNNVISNGDDHGSDYNIAGNGYGNGYDYARLTNTPNPSEYAADDEKTPLLLAEPTIFARLTDSQLRMVHWLNALDPVKYLSWFPDAPNSHAVIIVRDPAKFPIHERGRGVLKHWAATVGSH